MSDIVNRLIINFAFNNLVCIGLLVMAFAASGTVLGFLKRRATARPQAVMIGLAVAALIGGGLLTARYIQRATADPADLAESAREETEQERTLAREEYAELTRQFDEMHHFGVMGEEQDYRRYFSYPHRDGRAVYHRHCRECDDNFAIKKRMDEILRNYPEWTPGGPPLPDDVPPPPRRSRRVNPSRTFEFDRTPKPTGTPRIEFHHIA